MSKVTTFDDCYEQVLENFYKPRMIEFLNQQLPTFSFVPDRRIDHRLRRVISRESNYVIRRALRARARSGWKLDLFSTQLSRQSCLEASVGKYRLWKLP